MTRATIAWLAALAVLASSCSASSVIFVDSKNGDYLAQGSAPVKVSSDGLSSVISALTGLLPAFALNHADSQQIGRIVQRAPLKTPRAHVILNVAGLSTEEASSLFTGRQSRLVDVAGSEGVAKAVSSAVCDVATANPMVQFVSLDQAALQSCKSNCIEEFLGPAADRCNAKASGDKLVLPGGAALDISKISGKMFAVEVSGVFAGLQQELASLITKAERQNAEHDVEVYEATLLGLQGLAHTYGAESAEVQAAKDALKQLLQWAVTRLDEVFNGDLTYQVTAFDAAPASGSVEAIMGWKQESRRRMQATTTSSFPGAEEASLAKLFTSKACAYGGFVLLLYFSLGAVYCMCFMPFKQDTLLYGSTKKDA